ncbi:MAG TPA: DUF533 domain-containing protein [Pusillimonas sp.]|uniref:DUF533 domain-containing protein n=1 Tax=Pusillimonas sp. TaxID=3040095 RepID=UPI002B7A1EA3|nr:DUF533 domain-containing protein [Pusillimonas sp.]HUH86555.1 DUF533 domain-containing protein [Pusillimonas sp.]
MSVQQLLQQLLQSGQSLTREAGSKMNASSLSGSKLGGFGGGALAGGALGLLLGNKKFRKMGGKLATYGGTAALGALALKAYQDWQSRSSATQAAAQPAAPQAVPPPALSAPAATPVAVPVARLEQDSKILLAAMIAAAKADGHIGADEKHLIDAEVAKLTNDPADLAWFEAELAKPADPAQAAALASTPEQAAEVYLASLIVVDEESFMERAYLDELARQLNLDSGLKTELEAQVRSLG